MVPVASAITPINELALALTSGQGIKLAVSVGHVIIWIACRHPPKLASNAALDPDDHEIRLKLVEADEC